MFHMLSSFNLKDGASQSQFDRAKQALCAHLKDLDLLVSAGPICQRASSTPMDTDETRAHTLLFVTTFKDQAQCDAAYDHINQSSSKAANLHWHMMKNVANDAVFSCWSETSVSEPN